MADGLADVMAGGGPLMPQLLGAQMAAQQAAPQNLGGPTGMGFGLWSSVLAQGRAEDYARQIAQAQQGAMGDLGKYLQAADPVAAAAADTGGDPVARWQMMRTTPLQLGQMREQMANAALARANAALAGLNVAGFTGLQQPQTGAATGPGVPPIGAPATRRVPGPPTQLTSGSLGGGDYVPDPMVIPPDQRRAVYNKLTPRQQQLFRARLAQAGGAAAAAA